MTHTPWRRQIIWDTEGNPVAVVLPIAEYNRVKVYLEARPALSHESALSEAELTALDALRENQPFFDDLETVMSLFAATDAEWS